MIYSSEFQVCFLNFGDICTSLPIYRYTTVTTVSAENTDVRPIFYATNIRKK